MTHKATLQPTRQATPPPPPAAPALLERAWLHQCGRLVAGTDTTWCPGCRTDIKRSSEVEARYVLVPVQDPSKG